MGRQGALVFLKTSTQQFTLTSVDSLKKGGLYYE